MKYRIQQIGFTLIEVMITVAVMGVLLLLGIPSYQDYVVRGEVDRCFKYITPARMVADNLISMNGSTDVVTGEAVLGLSQNGGECEVVDVRVNEGVVAIEGEARNVTLIWSRAAASGFWQCSASVEKFRPDTCTQ